jgi:hypothetical protein
MVANCWRKHLFYAIGAWSAWLSCGIELSSARPGDGAPDLDNEIRRVRRCLVSALRTADADTALAAADRLASLAGTDKATWTELIDAMSRPKKLNPLSPPYVDALAAAGRRAIPDILRALKGIATPSPDSEFIYRDETLSFIGLIASLGRMGVQGKEAAATLRQFLADDTIDRRIKAAIRVALANISDPSADELHAIQSDLQRDERLFIVVIMLQVIRPGPWVSKDMIAELCKRFDAMDKDNPRRGYTDLAVVLGMLGERAGCAARPLDRFRKFAQEDDNPEAVIYSLALARVDPSRRDEVLKQLYEFLRGGISERGAVHYLSNKVPLLVDASIIKSLAAAISDPSPIVGNSAYIVLMLSGEAAHPAFPSVLAFVRGTGDEDRRAYAAQLLRFGDYSELPHLQRLLTKERSEPVRAGIESAIRAMKRENTKP